MAVFNYEYFWLVVWFLVVVSLCPTMLYIGNKYIKPYVSNHSGFWYDVLGSLFKTPFVVAIFLVASFIALHRLHLPAKWMQPIGSAYEVLYALNIVWFLIDLINGILDKIYNRSQKTNKKIDINVIKTVKKVNSAFFLFVGVTWSLNALGIDVKALLATLGIGGVAVAFAAQESVKNIIGGITIIVDSTLRIGDLVKVGDVEGTVDDIGLRSTKIRAYSGRLIIIPNSKLVDSNVENITSEPTRSVVCKLGLTYSTTPEKMEEAINILRDISKTIPELSDNPIVYFSGYGDSSLNITYTYYIKNPRKTHVMEVKSNVNMEILRRFNKAGLDFAFPTQTLYIEKEP